LRVQNFQSGAEEKADMISSGMVFALSTRIAFLTLRDTNLLEVAVVKLMRSSSGINVRLRETAELEAMRCQFAIRFVNVKQNVDSCR
jgi:hypothetical protein